MPEPGKQAPAQEGTERDVERNAALLSLGTLASRLLGMVRETLIAATFSSASTDAFFLAWRIPNALRAMLAEGAANNALNPVLGDALKDPEKGSPTRFREALASIRGAGLLVLSITTLLGVLFARPLFSLSAGALSEDPERFELGVSLLRMLFPYLFLMGWFAIGNAALRLLNDFMPGAFAPVLLNVAFVFLPPLLLPLLGLGGIQPIFALALAALVGGVLQVLWLYPALKKHNLLPKSELRGDEHTIKLRGLFVPIVYGQAVYQINTIIAGRFLGGLPRGNASWFNYAQRLADIPQGIFAVALSGAVAVALQNAVSANQHQQAAQLFERTTRRTAFVALPLAVLLAVYADAVVPLVFGYGRLLREGNGVYEVTRSLRWQALGVALQAFVFQLTPVFSAYKQRAIVSRQATVSLVVFIVSGWILTPKYGHVGVAIALLCSTTAQLLGLLYYLRTLIPAKFSAVWPTFARVLFATGLMALAARWCVSNLPLTGTSVNDKALALACGGALVFLYLVVAHLAGLEETAEVLAFAQRKLSRRR